MQALHVSMAYNRTCFFVRGKVASFTAIVSKMMEKPYEYGTCRALKFESNTCIGTHSYLVKSSCR